LKPVDCAIALPLAYLVGSIPFGLVVARAVKGIDIRKAGSGNVGATNVGRVIGWRWGLLVFLFDALKGFAPVYALAPVVAGSFALGLRPASDTLQILCGVAAILGHTFPVWLGFKGGKGVATGFGVAMGFAPLATAVALVTWIVVVAFTRYVSVASMAAALALPAAFMVMHRGDAFGRFRAVTAVLLFAGMLVILRHRQNIRRLLKGEENRIFSKKKEPVSQ
jgi:glycerol-3-phosphate acyltransferase PlsY